MPRTGAIARADTPLSEHFENKHATSRNIYFSSSSGKLKKNRELILQKVCQSVYFFVSVTMAIIFLTFQPTFEDKRWSFLLARIENISTCVYMFLISANVCEYIYTHTHVNVFCVSGVCC
jgi:hypothetical protein